MNWPVVFPIIAVALAIGFHLSGQIVLLYGRISTQMIDTGTPFPLRMTPSFAPNSTALFNSPRTMAEHVLDGCLQFDCYSVGCGCRTSAFAGEIKEADDPVLAQLLRLLWNILACLLTR